MGTQSRLLAVTTSFKPVTSAPTTVTSERDFLTIVNGDPVHWTLPRPFISDACLVLASDHPSTPGYTEWDTNPTTICPPTGRGSRIHSSNRRQVQIQGRAPGRKSNLQVFLDGVVTQGNAKGSTIPLAWDHGGYASWFVSGGDGWLLVLQIPPPGWMAQNPAKLGSKTLKQITIPGPYDPV